MAFSLEYSSRSFDATVRHINAVARHVYGGTAHLLFTDCQNYVSDMLLAGPLAAERMVRAARSTTGPRILAYATADEHGCGGLPTLHNLVNAFRGEARTAASIPVTDPAVADEVRSLFRSIGIPLSSRVSISAASDRWTVHDSATDLRFRIVRVGHLLQVYGDQEGLAYSVGSSRMPLPTRVFDASQGLAFFAVPAALVQAELDRHKALGLQAWRLDDTHAVLAMFIVDYRDSDFGKYQELGVAALATPVQEPTAVGMHTFFLGVNGEFTLEAGKLVWGFPKTLNGLAIEYHDSRVACRFWDEPSAQRAGQPPSLVFRMPRVGTRQSHRIPTYNYTQKNGALHRLIITRSGTGEGVQFDPRAVTLAMNGSESGQSNRVNHLLRRLGLTGDTRDRLLYAMWTEKMSAELTAPILLPFPSYGE